MARILIAEDDGSMRSFLTTALEHAGHTVTSVENGLDALNILRDKKAPDTDFDLLLSDIVMPGMDGIELSRKAADINPELKIMFITGFAAVAISETDSANTNTRLLSKPFHLNDLVLQVEKLLSA